MERGHTSRNFLEREVEPTFGSPQGRGNHVVQLEVRLQLGLVEVILLLTDLLGAVQVVPGLNHRTRVLSIGNDLHLGNFLAYARNGRRPDTLEKGMSGRRIGGHRVRHTPMSMARVTEQLRAPGAKPDNCHDRGLRIAGVPIVATALELLPDRFAQRSARGEGQNGVHHRARVHDRPPASEPPFIGSRPGSGYKRQRKAGKIGFGVEKGPCVLVCKHFRAEFGEARCERLIDLRKLSLFLGVQSRAAPDSALVHASHETRLLGVEVSVRQRLVHRTHSAKERRIEHDRIDMSGQSGQPLALELLVLRVRDVFTCHREHALDAIERTARPVDRGDRVLEGRRRRIGRDRLDLAALVGHGGFKRLREMRRYHVGPGRNTAIRPWPGSDQRVSHPASIRQTASEVLRRETEPAVPS